MARRVFFSFHYADVMNANIARNSGQFKPTSETGFYDKSLWEEAESKGKAALQKLIDAGLNNTSVTCFLIGKKHTNVRGANMSWRGASRTGRAFWAYCCPMRRSTGRSGLASTARCMPGITINS